MPKPILGLSWIQSAQPNTMLRDLGSGRIALTHEAFQQLPNWRTAAYLSDLLMQSGVLPLKDRQRLLFERWLETYLGTITNLEPAKLLRRFASWHQLRKLRAQAAKAPLRDATAREAHEQQIQAVAFLIWLTRHGTAVNDTRQRDLDAWQSENYFTRRPSHVFLT